MDHDAHAQATWPAPYLTADEAGPYYFWYLKPTPGTPYTPLGVYSEPPPPEAAAIGSVRVGNSAIAKAGAELTYWLNVWAHLSRYLPGLPH